MAYDILWHRRVHALRMYIVHNDHWDGVCMCICELVCSFDILVHVFRLSHKTFETGQMSFELILLLLLPTAKKFEWHTLSSFKKNRIYVDCNLWRCANVHAIKWNIELMRTESKIKWKLLQILICNRCFMYRNFLASFLFILMCLLLCVYHVCVEECIDQNM